MALDTHQNFSAVATSKPTTQTDPLDLFNQQVASVLSKPPPLSKDKMQKIVKASLRAHSQVKKVTMSIEKFIVKCEADYKVSGLYIMDMVMRVYRKKYGVDYAIMQERFGNNLKITLKAIWDSVKHDTTNSNRVKKVLLIWKNEYIFSPQVFQTCKDILRSTEWAKELWAEPKITKNDLNHEVSIAISSQSRLGVKNLQKKMGKDQFDALQRLIKEKVGLSLDEPDTVDHNMNKPTFNKNHYNSGDRHSTNMELEEDIPEDFEHMNRIASGAERLPPPKFTPNRITQDSTEPPPSYQLLPEPPEQPEHSMRRERNFDPAFKDQGKDPRKNVSNYKTDKILAPKVSLNADDYLAKLGMTELDITDDFQILNQMKHGNKRDDDYMASPTGSNNSNDSRQGRNKVRRKRDRISPEKRTISFAKHGDTITKTTRNKDDRRNSYESEEQLVTDEQLFGDTREYEYKKVGSSFNLPDPRNLPKPQNLSQSQYNEPPRTNKYGYPINEPQYNPPQQDYYENKRGYIPRPPPSGSYNPYTGTQYSNSSFNLPYNPEPIPPPIQKPVEPKLPPKYEKSTGYLNFTPKPKEPESNESKILQKQNLPQPKPIYGEKFETKRPKYIERKDYPDRKLIIFASSIRFTKIPKNAMGVESRLRQMFEKRGKVDKVSHYRQSGTALVQLTNYKDALDNIDFMNQNGRPYMAGLALDYGLVLGPGFDEFFGNNADKLKQRYFEEHAGRCWIPWRYIPKKTTQEYGDMRVLMKGNFIDLGTDLKISNDILMRFIDKNSLIAEIEGKPGKVDVENVKEANIADCLNLKEKSETEQHSTENCQKDENQITTDNTKNTNIETSNSTLKPMGWESINTKSIQNDYGFNNPQVLNTTSTQNDYGFDDNSQDSHNINPWTSTNESFQVKKNSWATLTYDEEVGKQDDNNHSIVKSLPLPSFKDSMVMVKKDSLPVVEKEPLETVINATLDKDQEPVESPKNLVIKPIAVTGENDKWSDNDDKLETNINSNKLNPFDVNPSPQKDNTLPQSPQKDLNISSAGTVNLEFSALESPLKCPKDFKPTKLNQIEEEIEEPLVNNVNLSILTPETMQNISAIISKTAAIEETSPVDKQPQPDENTDINTLQNDFDELQKMADSLMGELETEDKNDNVNNVGNKSDSDDDEPKFIQLSESDSESEDEPDGKKAKLS